MYVESMSIHQDTQWSARESLRVCAVGRNQAGMKDNGNRRKLKSLPVSGRGGRRRRTLRYSGKWIGI